MISLCAVIALSILPAKAVERGHVEAFLDVTGFDVVLDSIAYSAAHAPALLGHEAEDFGQDWTRISGEVFASPIMRNMAIEMLSQTLTPELLGHAASFYASDLGLRLVEVENAAHAEDNSDKKRLEGQAILNNLPHGDPRRAVFGRMSMAIDGSGQSLRAVQEVMVRFLMTASHAGALGYRIDEDALRALLKEDEPAMRADIEAGGLANAAYTYRNISTDDLIAYAEALEHPMMQQVYELMNAVQFEIMANRFETLAVKLSDIHPGEEL